MSHAIKQALIALAKRLGASQTKNIMLPDPRL